MMMVEEVEEQLYMGAYLTILELAEQGAGMLELLRQDPEGEVKKMEQAMVRNIIILIKFGIINMNSVIINIMNFTSVVSPQVMMVTQLESGLLEMLGMVAMVMEEGAMACMMEEGGVVTGVQVLHTTHSLYIVDADLYPDNIWYIRFAVPNCKLFLLVKYF